MPDPAPDNATIDAWLAGKLCRDEELALESYFEKHPEELPLASPELPFRELPQGYRDPKLAALIDEIKTQHGSSLPRPGADSWQDILRPAPEDSDLLGLLGDYEILEVIATGGMGIVFKARDPELKRLAAVKALSAELPGNATASARFLREARAAAKMEQENILPIYGVHDDAKTGTPHFAMRYASGGTLQDAIDAGEEFDLDRLKSITRQVAAALQTSHEHGIIHRDIKPANILFDEPDGEKVWVCDFGIARSTEDPTLTYADAVTGTPQYMSPEQAQGEPLDGRSDLFSLGAVMYRCATGQQAFGGATTAAVIQQVTGTSITGLPDGGRNLPDWFERLLANLLAKDPADRPRDAAAVVRAIDDQYSPRPKHRARRNRRLMIAAAAVLTLITSVLVALQIPPIRAAVNRSLAARFDQAFTIQGRIGAYEELSDAIAKAHDGDTINLPGGTAIGIDQLTLPPDKALALVAADPQQRPTLTTKIDGAPGIIASAPLKLSGLDFVVNQSRASDGIVVVRATQATIDDCSFTAQRLASSNQDDIKARTIDLHDGASVAVSHCHFDLQNTNAFTVFDQRPPNGSAPDPTTIDIRDSDITAFYAINLQKFASDAAEIHIETTASSFHGESFLKQNSAAFTPWTRCKVSGSEFTIARALCWFVGQDAALIRKKIRWNGTDNKFPNSRALLRVAPTSAHASTTSLRPVSEYSSKIDLLAKVLPAKPAGHIEIAETGKRFFSLAEAVAAAPDNATLTISGTIITDGEILTRQGQSLHLRPGPSPNDAIPTIETVDSKAHALFIIGASTVRGIRFSRQETDHHSLPLLGIKSDGGDVQVENCIFQTTPADGAAAGGRGLSLTDVGKALVRNCVFMTPEGTSLAVNFVNKDSLPGSVVVEDCILAGRTAVASTSRVPNTSTNLNIKRCVIACDRLLGNPPLFPLQEFHIQTSDCLIDTTESLLHLPGASRDRIRRNLSWLSERNIYRKGVHVLLAPTGKESSARQPISCASFSELSNFVPTVMDIEPRFSIPFDRSRFRRPITPQMLLQAVMPGISSPALSALEKFATTPASAE